MNPRTVVALLCALLMSTGALADEAIVGYGKARLGMSEHEFLAMQPPNTVVISKCIFARDLIEVKATPEPIKIDSLSHRCATSQGNLEMYKFDPFLTEISITETRTGPPGELACRLEMDETARQIAQKYGQFDFEPRRVDGDFPVSGNSKISFSYLYTSVVRGDRTIFLMAALGQDKCQIIVDYSLRIGKLDWQRRPLPPN